MQVNIEQATTIIDTRVFVYQKPRTATTPSTLKSARTGTAAASGLYYHLVFRASDNLESMSEMQRKKFYGFVFGCARGLRARIESIGVKGASVQLLVSLDPTQTPADFIRKMKLFTSEWARRKLEFPAFMWVGEEVATVSDSQRRRISSHIQSQGFLF